MIGLAIGLAGCLLPKQLEATVADAGAIVTIDDFSSWLAANDLDLRADEDELVKQKVAWSYLLTYDYLGRASLPDSEPLTVVLKSEVGVHPNATSAGHNFRTYRGGLKLGIEKSGGVVEPLEPTLRWGTSIDLFAIHKNGHQIGNGFIGHSGNVATYVLITGLYSSDPRLFEEAIQGKLAQLEAYDPKPPAPVAAALD